MRDKTAELAQSITWAGSKQTYLTGRLMVDKDLVNDFYRAYAYFRWVDDLVDAPASVKEYILVDEDTSRDVSSSSADERISFIRRQREIIDRLYNNEKLEDLTSGEEILADLINHDRGKDSGLQSFIRNMFAIIEFDSFRMGSLIREIELTWYTNSVAKSVTDGLQYFVGNGHPYPITDMRYSAALAAHITHLLRDMLPDMKDGFINIPREYLEAHHITPDDVQSTPYRDWVRSRSELARELFQEGKSYLNEMNVLRTKIVGYWYCARFESVLDTIENDGYILRPVYDERSKISTWFKIAWLGFSVTVRHFIRRIAAALLVS